MFKVFGQSYVGNVRVSKTFAARDEADALRIASAELEPRGFYVVSVTQA